MWEDFYSIRRFLIACTKKMYLFSCHSDDGVRRISQKIRREYFLICSFFSFVAVQSGLSAEGGAVKAKILAAQTRLMPTTKLRKERTKKRKHATK